MRKKELNKILYDISNNSICLRCWINKNGQVVHKWLFKDLSWISVKSLLTHYKEIERKINSNNTILLWLLDKYKDNGIIRNEINYHLNVHKFLLDFYNIDANKINNKYSVNNIPDYEYYSKLFYWVNSKDIPIIKDDPIFNPNYMKYNIKKSDIINLLEFSKKKFPIMEYNFSKDIGNMLVSWFRLGIPDQESYNIKSVITLFFHEMSHFIRMYNSYNNLEIKYSFYNNYKIEEWISLYNEYYYWNQIIQYGKYYPWYDKIYNILFNEKKLPKEKKEEMARILSFRWFSKEKSLKYYYRFYRNVPTWWTSLFLKESIYSRALKKVEQLLNSGYTIWYLMKVKGDIDTIDYLSKKYDIKENNIHEEYFNSIRDKIIKLL